MSNIIQYDYSGTLQQAAKFTEGIASLKVQSEAIKVVDDETREECLRLMGNAKKRLSGLTALWKSIKDPINAVRTTILQYEKDTTADASAVAALCESKVKRYDLAQQEAKRRAEADLARQAAAQQRELEQARKDLLAEGMVKEAKAIESQVRVLDNLPVLPNAIEKVSGVSVTAKYKAIVTDIMSVIAAVATGKVPLFHECNGQKRPLLIVDQVVLNALAKRQQDALRIPGVSVEEDIGYTHRG